MHNNISQNQAQKISEHFGQGFYQKVQSCLEVYSKRWKLSKLSLVEYYSVNCIFTCHSDIYGKSVLKICNSSVKGFLSECNSLQEFSGGGFCRLYDFDSDDEVMLIERLSPGTQLKSERSLDKRLSEFSALFRSFHKTTVNVEKYDTYVGWVLSITDFMEKLQGFEELTGHMIKARDICLEVASEYNRKMLLHGDFHYDNILLNGDEYKIIDPKGVIGDPVFDLPRYTLNEYWDSEEKTFDGRLQLITKVMGYFESSLGISPEIQKKCLYVEMSMAECWSVKPGYKPNLDSLIFAKYLMEN